MVEENSVFIVVVNDYLGNESAIVGVWDNLEELGKYLTNKLKIPYFIVSKMVSSANNGGYANLYLEGLEIEIIETTLNKPIGES